jgi:hypothetical protein
MAKRSRVEPFSFRVMGKDCLNMECEEHRINSILSLSSRARNRSLTLMPAYLVVPLPRILVDGVN